MDQSLRMFLFGLAGSAAIEILSVLAVYEGGRQSPARYRRPGFWVVRCLMGLTGGLLAIGYGVQSDIVALHIGATAPLILGNLRRSPPDAPGRSPPDRIP
jgi:hypothetical protein